MAAGQMTSIDQKLAAFDLATGQDACERLLSIDGLPPEVDARTRRRMAALAPSLDAIAPSMRSWPIPIPLPGGWSMHGASIAAANDGFRMIARSGNFTRNGDRSRAIHDANGMARSRSSWVELDAGLRVRAVHAIHEHGLQRGDVAIPPSGLLHGHPVFVDGTWWIVGVIGDAEAGEVSRPVLGWLDGVWLRETRRLDGGAGRGARWNPIAPAPGEPLRFMATVFPTVVWRAGSKPGSVRIEKKQAAPLIARRLTGATPLIPADNGYLGLALESVALENGDQQIIHRWVWFDRAICLAGLSRPFLLQRGGSEAASGLTRSGDDLVISFARGDGCLGLATVPEEQVLPLLAPPLQLDLDAIERQLTGEPVSVAAAAPRKRSTAAWNPTVAATIASMTMTGNNRDIVGDAVRSVVDWVDWCVLIDTGIEDDTIEIAREIAGDKLVVREFAWRHDFSAARNFALEAAAETGADWAVFVDSDERLVLNDVDIHEVLASSPEPVLLVPHSSGEYTKDRFFRLPASGAFRGPTHEAFYITWEIGGGIVAIPGVVFQELQKSPERMRLKDERDRDILIRHTEANPGEPRWFYYLGDGLMRLGQYEDAVTAFRACYALRGWNEESAWAMYRATQCLYELNRLEDALEAIVLGMARHAGLADFPWFAAHISQRLGRSQQAVYWARQAIALGRFAGIGQTVPRVGWRYPFALWEGPYDVLRVALKDLGDDEGAAEAERLFAQAAAARQAQPANV